MTMTMNRSLIAIPFALLLTSCSNQQPAPVTTDATPVAASNSTPPAPAPAARIEVAETRFIHAEPAELDNCDYGVVLVKWNTSTAETPPAVVEIYSGSSAGETPGLFAAAGATGEKETGPWVRPGSTFSLRDKATGAELERLVIGGPRCD